MSYRVHASRSELQVSMRGSELQGEDEDGEEHLIAQSRSQEFTVGVIFTGAILDHDPESPPAGDGGGAGGGQLPLSRAVSPIRAAPPHSL